jgi:hypothetical protein
MKTLQDYEKEFDEFEIIFIPYDKIGKEKVDAAKVLWETMEWSVKKSIKQFYRTAIKEIVDEIIDDRSTNSWSGDDVSKNEYFRGYNLAKAEQRQRAKEIGII